MVVRRRGALAAVLALALAAPVTARADEPAPAAPPPPSTARRALAITAAVVPGIVVRGAGHWTVRDRRAARRLLIIEGIGLGLAAAGAVPIALTGAAGETMPGLAVLVPGAGLLVGSLAADIWGAAGGAAVAGPPLAPHALELALGTAVLADPRVPFETLATAAVDVRRGAALGGVSGWVGDGAWQVGVSGGARVYGPRPGGPAPTDGTSLDLVLTAAEERRAAEDFTVTSFDAGVRARLDLFHVAPSLRGTFLRAGLGLGAERIRYPAVEVADVAGLFTGHFAWGFTLGDGRRHSLEAELIYEHRRDTLAGGVTLPSTTNGFIGYFGASATGWRDRWGASFDIEAGSAWVFSLTARYRMPELP